MVIDTSALLELFASREGARQTAAALTDNDGAKASAVVVLETAAILRQNEGPESVERFLSFLIAQKIKIIPFDGDQLLASLLGDARYAKTSDNKIARDMRLAELATYGLAKHLGEPVLHNNQKLSETDLVAIDD